MEAKRKEREHVRCLKLLKRQLLLKNFTAPIYGIVRNCVNPPESFEIRDASDIHFLFEGGYCVGVMIPTQHGTMLTLASNRDFTIKVGKDAAGKAIFFTDLNQ